MLPKDSDRRLKTRPGSRVVCTPAPLIGKMPMKHIGRAKEKSETQGFMKVLVDEASKEILGAAILGHVIGVVGGNLADG